MFIHNIQVKYGSITAPRATLELVTLTLLFGATACDQSRAPEPNDLALRNATPAHYRIPDCAKEPLSGDTITIEDDSCGEADKATIETIKSEVKPGDVVTYKSSDDHAIARHVTDVACNGKELTTEAAHIGHIAHAANWSDQEVDDLASQLSGKIASATSAALPTPTLSYPGIELGIDVAKFQFQPELSFELQRSGFSIDEFKLAVSVTPDVELGFSATLDQDLPDLAEIADSIGLEDLTEKQLLPPATFEEVIVVGDVPVLTVTTFALYLGAEAEGEAHSNLAGKVGLSQKTMELGVTYNGNDWDIETPSLDPTFIGELDEAASSGRMKIRLKLRGTVSVDLYDLTGPELSFIPYAELEVEGDAPSIDARVDMGIDGGIGIEATLFHWFGKALSWEKDFHIVDPQTVWPNP